MFAFGIALIPQDEGLWSTILENLPRDPASVFVLLLVTAAVIAVWLGNRRSG